MSTTRKYVLALALIIAILAIASLLAGCSPSGAIDPSGLRKPDAVLMIDPGEVPRLKAGDDLKARYASLKRDRGQLASRLRGLQRYVRTVTASK